MAPFTFGKDFRPDMVNDEANVLSQIDRMTVAFQTKSHTTDSILEHMILTLKVVQKDKTWSNE